MRRVYSLGVVALAVLAVVGAVLISRAANASARADAATLARSGGCEPPKSFPMEGRTHVSYPQTVSYKTDPPTSGNHYIGSPTLPAGQQRPDLTAPTSTGVHDTQIPNEVQVHNLEHGHVLIQYQPNVAPAVIPRLQALASKDSSWVIVAPRQNATAKIAFTAWTIKQVCNDPTNPNMIKVAQTFIDRFKNQGPESIPGQPSFARPRPSLIPRVTITSRPSLGGRRTPVPKPAQKKP